MGMIERYGLEITGCDSSVRLLEVTGYAEYLLSHRKYKPCVIWL